MDYPTPDVSSCEACGHSFWSYRDMPHQSYCSDCNAKHREARQKEKDKIKQHIDRLEAENKQLKQAAEAAEEK